MNKVTIYTDGSCHGNPGAGGYAAVVLSNGVTKEVYGGDWYTTNNRMELTAVVEGLRLLSQPANVRIVTDSKYIVNQINRGGLCAYVNTPGRKNADLWQKILQLSLIHNLSAEWVRGHSGDYFNQRCDRIANNEASKLEREKGIRTAIFSKMLMDATMTAEAIARSTGISVHTVRKYQMQFYEHQAAIGDSTNEQ